MKLLTRLIEQATEVVPKEELMRELWPPDTFVEEQNLTNLISEIRKVFKDRDPSRGYVTTYRGQGYSFDLPARQCDGNHRGSPYDAPFKRDGFFNDFFTTFNELLARALHAELFFIHGNRWRSNHIDGLLEFLTRQDSLLTIYLPNLKNRVLLDAFKSNFDEGDRIEGMIREAYADFARMQFDYPNKFIIRSYDFYPGYSFYRFDNKLVVSMYPITPQGKHGVPTFYVEEGSKYWSFFLRDLERLRDATPLEEDELQKHLV